MQVQKEVHGIYQGRTEVGRSGRKIDFLGCNMPLALLYALFTGLLLGHLNPIENYAKDDVTESRMVTTGGVSRPTMRTLLASSKPSIDLGAENMESREKKLLIIVTGTRTRAFQLTYLTRIAHKLLLVPSPLLWVVVECGTITEETASLLKQTGLMYRHVATHRRSRDSRDRTVLQRNAALYLIAKERLDGIVYFADDDMVYSLELFDELRTIKRFGAWPVATLTQGRASVVIEGPLCEGTTVVGWHTRNADAEVNRGRFQAHTGGYAFNSTLLWDPARWDQSPKKIVRQPDAIAKEPLQESSLVEQLVDSEDQMQGLADGCLRILVWHAPLEATSKSEYPRGWVLGPRSLLPVTIPIGSMLTEDPIPVPVVVVEKKQEMPPEKRNTRSKAKETVKAARTRGAKKKKGRQALVLE